MAPEAPFPIEGVRHSLAVALPAFSPTRGGAAKTTPFAEGAARLRPLCAVQEFFAGGHVTSSLVVDEGARIVAWAGHLSGRE